MRSFFFKLFLLITFLFLSSGDLLAQVNWTKYAGNPVIKVPGAWYNGAIASCVIYNADSSRYEMFFSGSTTAAGERPCRIGLAYSNNGLSWEVRSTPVLTPTAGTWDSYTTEFPNVIIENGVYKMWYTGAQNTSTYKIGYATSLNGITWTKHPTPVLDAGPNAWEVGGLATCYVLPITGGYKMWYGGGNADFSKECIGYATSTDGILWQKDTQNNPILQPGISGVWDDTYVVKPSVMFKDNIYYLWYLGAGTTSGQFRIGLATSPNGINNWTKHPNNPVLTPSSTGWDRGEVESPNVILVGDTLFMYYDGSPSGSYVWQIGLAKSLYTPLPLPPGTYTVGTGGNFATIRGAFNKLETDGVAGNVTLELIDELYVAPAGQYGFSLNGPIPGAGPNSRVTIKPAVNKNVVIKGNGQDVLAAINTSYVIIDGVGLTGPTTLTIHALYNNQFGWNAGIEFIDNSDHNIFRNIIFLSDDINRGGGGPGLYTRAGINTVADSNLIENNFIKKCGAGAIYITFYNATLRGTGNIVRSNFIGSETDSLLAWGIQVEHAQNTIVENNVIQNLKHSPTQTSNVLNIGINSYYGLGDIIRNNIVRNIQSSAGYTCTGILLSGGFNESGNNNQVYNNMVYGIQSTSTNADSRVAGIQMWSQVSPKIYFNTVYLSGSGANNQGSAALYTYAWGNCTEIDVRNNILINTRNESPHCASSICLSSGTSIATSNYNDLYYSPSAYNCAVRMYGTNYNTLADWQATGKDLNSVSKLVNFVSATDLHLTGSSNGDVDLIGTPIAGITTDIDGNTRNALYPYKGADEASISLPVELTSFTAQAENQKVILRWTTATEINNNGFEIQRKVAESDFATVGFVRGEGTTTNQREYSYIDKDLADGKYIYRLKQVDYNGTYEYSNEIEVDVRSLNEYALEQNYPNPFNPVTTIGYVLQEKSNAKVTLLNSLGEEIAVLVNEEQDKGYHKVEFDGSKLSSGVYFYQLKAGAFVSAKKMILLR